MTRGGDGYWASVPLSWTALGLKQEDLGTSGAVSVGREKCESRGGGKEEEEGEGRGGEGRSKWERGGEGKGGRRGERRGGGREVSGRGEGRRKGRESKIAQAEDMNVDRDGHTNSYPHTTDMHSAPPPPPHAVCHVPSPPLPSEMLHCR